MKGSFLIRHKLRSKLRPKLRLRPKRKNPASLDHCIFAISVVRSGYDLFNINVSLAAGYGEDRSILQS